MTPEDFPLSANGPAYTKTEGRHGVPLEYVGDKLGTAIEEINRVARRHPPLRRELAAPMHYAVVAFLGLHNMLGKANDRTLVDRLLDATPDELDAWIALVLRDGDVAGLAGLAAG